MRKAIVRSLAYFDIFNHPLSRSELAMLCGVENNDPIFLSELEHMLTTSTCFMYRNYYAIKSTVKGMVEERLQKESLAIDYVKKLPGYVKIIKAFPFVKAVAISGSLSKGVMYQKGDIDYFIITAKNRLWICRTLLIFFKKFFLLNSRKYFCLNYFVDEDNLEIIDKNYFTAIEINALLPVFSEEIINHFKKANAWTGSYLERFESPIRVACYLKEPKIKSILESLINLLPADRIDLFFMKLTYSRWSKKFKSFDASKLELTMRSNRGVSKHHPKDFQNKVLKEYKKRLLKFNIEDERPVFS